MPEKQIPKDIWLILVMVPFLTALAKSLSTFNCGHTTWKDFAVQCVVGMASGALFGLLACWLIGNYQAAVGAISGFGTILSIKGVERIAMALEQFILKKFK